MLGCRRPADRAVAMPAVVLGLATVLGTAGCGSGDSTVAKTPEASATAQQAPTDDVDRSAAPAPVPADPDRCAVDLAAPAIIAATSELPRDPRSGQPWNPEPLAGNYSPCAELSAVIVKANTNAEHPSTRALLFHLGEFLPESAPDTSGFDGIDLAQSSPDTVALQHSGGAAGLVSVVKFRWNGHGVEIVGNIGTVGATR